MGNRCKILVVWKSFLNVYKTLILRFRLETRFKEVFDFTGKSCSGFRTAEWKLLAARECSH